MFTGLIEETGVVLSVIERGGVHRIAVQAPALARRLRVGDSIAVSGVCLTALAIAPPALAQDELPDRFEADLAAETVRRTSLSRLTAGTVVNLELPTPAGTPLGGHIVQGHVDGVGRLITLQALHPDAPGSDWWLEIEIPENIQAYVVEKGSIAVEGISLTVAKWERGRAGIAIIPHTYAHTNLRTHQPGDLLNLEADVLLRHAAQSRATGQRDASALTLESLIANGY